MVHISERERELPEGVIGRLIDIAATRKDIISLGPGEPDFPLPQPLVSFLRKIALDKRINHYAPPGGFLELREAICHKLKKKNKINATPENVVVTNGSQEALLLACMTALDPTEQIIIPNPSFMSYLPVAEMVDAVPVSVELHEENGFEIDPDAVRKAIDPRKTEAIVINSPANPTGNVLSKKVIEELAEIAVEYDLYLFSDEAYEDIIYDGVRHHSPASLNGMGEHVVSFYTFSKSYALCGFRLGYAVGPKEAIEAMTRLHVDTSICAPTISQLLGVKALSLNKKKYVEPMVKEYNRRRRLIVKRLNEMGLPTLTPKGAFYTFSRISHISKDSRKFALDLLKKAHVAVVPGSEFGKSGEGYIRCSYATKYELIENAMERIETFVRSQKS